MRLFIAINLEDSMKDSLCNVIEEMKRYATQGNFMRRENLHLTLAFLGETDRLEAAEQVISQIHCKPFFLQLDGLGKFNRGGGDIYWAGFRNSKELFALQNMLSRQLSNAGFSIEDRRYTPHLTLGREIIFQQGTDERVFEKSLPPLTMKVSKISLMRSQRIQGRLTYTELEAQQF